MPETKYMHTMRGLLINRASVLLALLVLWEIFLFSSRRRHPRSKRDWSSDVCSSDLDHGHLRALAVTASSYTSGRHVTFYQSLYNYEIAAKLQRTHVHGEVTLDHLLASSAIPFRSEERRVGKEYNSRRATSPTQTKH